MKERLIILSVSLGIFLLTEINFLFYFLEFESLYTFSVIEPLSYISLSIFVTILILLFFNENIYKLWLKYILSWFGPIALLIIMSGSTGSSFAYPDRSTFAILFGMILVVITLLFTLVQKFYFRR